MSGGQDSGPQSGQDGGRGKASIARRAGLVATGTLSSRILGLVRDAVFAATFAVSSTDLFFVAFTIPNALRVVLGEGAISGAFVPVFSDVRQREGHARARRFLAGLTGSMTIVLGAVAAVGVAAAPGLVMLYAAGYRDDPARFETTVLLTRLVFPYIFLIGLASIAVAALNSLKRFAVPAFAPALLNVALIAAPFALVPAATGLDWPPIAALALGALVGGVLQGAVQLPSIAKNGLLARPRLGFGDPEVRRALKLLVPLIAGLGVYQLNVLLSRQFASFLEPGAQSYLYYAQRLVEIPQGMFAMAIATASLPTLSDLHSRGDTAEVNRLFRYALRLSLFVAVPSTVALVLLAEPTVAVLFGRGEFGAEQLTETGRTLAWQAVGVWAIASVRTTIPVFHAYKDTRTPVVASALNLVAFVATALLLMGPMQQAGIAAGISAAGIVQLGALLVLLRRKVGPLGLGSVAASFGRSVGASAVMGVVVWALAGLGAWENGSTLTNIGLYAATVLAGALVYLLAARLLQRGQAL
jgi:putative peptidoglycan lipid II flippase